MAGPAGPGSGFTQWALRPSFDPRWGVTRKGVVLLGEESPCKKQEDPDPDFRSWVRKAFLQSLFGAEATEMP